MGETGEAGGNEREAAALLDRLRRKLQGIHEKEVPRTAARAAADALSIAILGAVFARCSAALLDADADAEGPHRARVLAELFDL